MDEKKRYNLFGFAFFALIGLLIVSVFLAMIFMPDNVVPTGEYVKIWENAKILTVTIWIVCIPLLIILYMKQRKLEIPPTDLDPSHIDGRDANQCNICQKHPFSKKYHLKHEHKLKDFKLDDYFVDCGCDRCTFYNMDHH